MGRWLIALVLLGTGAPAAAAAAPLQRYAPVVVQDSAEQSPLTGVKAFAGVVPGVLDGAPQPTIYGRRAGNWLQYWLFYAAERQKTVVAGRHAGDWELVQYEIRNSVLVRGVYSQHDGAERCSSLHIRTRTDRPVVFVANGSHAGYFVPGTRDRPWPEPNDVADGEGLRVRPRLVRISEQTPPWMTYAGRWGGDDESPRGPRFTAAWSDPDAFARTAMPCTRYRCDQLGECDGRETGVAAIAAGLGTLWALLYGRRRIRRLPAGR
jgi:hypothetical protein